LPIRRSRAPRAAQPGRASPPAARRPRAARTRLTGIARAQQRGQIAIDFDHFEPSGSLQQPLREGSLAGPDLHRGVARLQVDRRHDARDDGRIVQEMLAEALARAAV
jgi:hypothetical protein